MPDLAEERFKVLRERQVGFQLFEQKRAKPLPGKTYVACMGKYVLLAFEKTEEAEIFFNTAMEETL
jgi:hypothetical protein